MDANSPAVDTHLTILQSVIARMAESSRATKTWCAILISAILIVGGGMTKLDNMWIAYVPLILFIGLDMYYLSLERRFRASYNSFLNKLRSGNVTPSDLYEVKPAGSSLTSWVATLTSFLVWPFYLMLTGVIAFVWWRIGT